MAATATEKKSMDVVRGYVKHVFNGRDYDRVSEFQAEDFVQHGPMPDVEVHGNEESIALLQMWHEAFSDVGATEEICFSDGEFVCSQYTYRGTHDGELMGIDATDMDCEVTGTIINRVEDGKIAEAWVSLDLFGLLQQVSVLPEMDELAS